MHVVVGNGVGARKFEIRTPGKLSVEEWQKQFNSNKNNLDKTVGEKFSDKQS